MQVFETTFRTENVKAHVKKQHNRKYNQYSNILEEEKVSFFSSKVPYVFTISTFFGSYEKRLYTIHYTIVDDIIKHFLLPRVDDSPHVLLSYCALGKLRP